MTTSGLDHIVWGTSTFSSQLWHCFDFVLLSIPVVPLTFWNPSDDLLALVKEGEPVEIYKLQASTTRTSDPFVPCSHRSSLPPGQQEAVPPGTVLSLSGGRTTHLRPLVSSLHATVNCDPSDVVDADLISQVYQPRRVLCVTDLPKLCTADQSDFCLPLKDAQYGEC
ncbi:hypothetical protein P879_11993 [Paragonimus westermani]|uniref:Uncharacterized protein n=1 Tax=Paragonimus westermani TaxID=34504 RepID=A0A8T0D5L1_9TREM|nr:hypothetical protein P879_11993 [Paragonimus westermani]